MKIPDKEYIDSELAKINFDWKIKKVNDIETNPIYCYWTIGEVGNLKRFYKIVPHNKCDQYGIVDSNNSTEYFALYEACSYDINEEVSNIKRLDLNYYDGIIPNNLSLIAIYENINLAKNRAKFQMFIINNLIKTYCPTNEN